MRYLSVCSGIEAASVAWSGLGWEAVAFAEIEPFPSAVLAHHYPSTPNWGDMSRFKEWPDATLDVLVGGTPCQSFSVAGLRKGLDDPRGNLMLTYLAIADRYRPQWVVWENVPGVLSSGGGRDFGTFLGALGELGYGWAYRVLDAQWFGVAQHRRRVFVVGCLGDAAGAAAVLFECESVSRHPAPSREAGQGVTGAPGGSSQSGGFRTTDLDNNGAFIPVQPFDVANCLTQRMHKGINTTIDEGQTPVLAHALRGEGFDASEDGTGRGTPIIPVLPIGLDEEQNAIVDGFGTLKARTLGGGFEGVVAHAFDARQSDVIQYGDKTGPLDTDGHSMAIAFSSKDHAADIGEDVSPTLLAGGHTWSHANGGVMPAVAYDSDHIMPTMDARAGRSGANSFATSGGLVPVAFAQNQVGEVRTSDVVGTLNTNTNASGRNTPMVQTTMQVRRLTAVECERLQGFPDNYTAIPWRKKDAAECPDGPRYKALGNSMAVPVMRWIGERIARVAATGSAVKKAEVA